MNATDFRSAIMDYIREQAKPVDKFSHQPRLYELTREIGAGQNYDDDVVFAAAWLHDLGVFIGHRPEDPANSPVGLRGLRDEADAGHSSAPWLSHGEDCRRGGSHPHPSAAGESDDDRRCDRARCGHSGAIGRGGILRTVSKIGRDTRFQTFPDALRVLHKNADTLPRLLRLPKSRAVGKSTRARIAVLSGSRPEGALRSCGLRFNPPRGLSVHVAGQTCGCHHTRFDIIYALLLR